MNYLRQQEILDPELLSWPLTLIGLGGIGSAAAQVLVKQGWREWRLWDDDQVADVNVPNQLLYRPSDVGQPKVQAAAEILKTYAPVSIETHQERFRSGQALHKLRYILHSLNTQGVCNFSDYHTG